MDLGKGYNVAIIYTSFLISQITLPYFKLKYDYTVLHTVAQNTPTITYDDDKLLIQLQVELAVMIITLCSKPFGYATMQQLNMIVSLLNSIDHM